MRFSSPVRTDLVISMTLAETFLLLLFVVWYGHTSILSIDPCASIKERLAWLEKENERTNKELKEAKNLIADLQFRLKLWEDITGSKNPPTREGLLKWAKEAGRGHRKCEENNVLVHASVVQGQISMVWLNESPNLSKWLAESGRPRPKLGVPINDRSTIQALLDGVLEYYSSTKVDGDKCRFDYRLTYGSKEDYYDGRQLFERYFYPAGMSQVGRSERVAPGR